MTIFNGRKSELGNKKGEWIQTGNFWPVPCTVQYSTYCTYSTVQTVLYRYCTTSASALADLLDDGTWN
jgi:hypothetical protein